MPRFLAGLFCAVLVCTSVSSGLAQTFSHRFTREQLTFPAVIDGATYQLQCMLYRPESAGRYPLVVFSHGRNGIASPYEPNAVQGYREICEALAHAGYVVAFVVRRGYGDSEGADVELRDTAVQSGLEAAKDYKAAVEYWRTKDFVLADTVLVMGQSQGGWAAIACTNVPMEGVVGAVNISGGTNYRLMGGGAVTTAVQDHWVAGCATLGRNALVPSFWIYSENDQSISGPVARRMFQAFTAAGGEASLLMLPPYRSNGHEIVGRPSLFLAQLLEFFDRIGFVGLPVIPPTVEFITGPAVVAPGEKAVLKAEVAGYPLPIVEWLRNGSPIDDSSTVTGAKTATLTVTDAGAVHAGEYAIRGFNAGGSVDSKPWKLSVRARPAQSSVPNGDPGARIVGLATRGIVGTGENVLIAGFVIAGTGPKTVSIVASGHTLAQRSGLADTLGRPRLTLHRHEGAQDLVLDSNSDWQTNSTEITAAMAEIGGQPLIVSTDPARGDAGLVRTLQPGVYTAVVDAAPGSANAGGIALLEVYDVSREENSRLTGISTRGLVEAGDRQMIVGVVIGGQGHARLMIRGVGPGLRALGIQRPIANPAQTLFLHGSGTTGAIQTNDDWCDSAQREQTLQLGPEIGAFELAENSPDSVIIRRVEPGAYSSVVSDTAGGSGVVLTEIYDATVQ